MTSLQEYRCHTNNKLLCRAGGEGQVEIMNPSNRVISYTGPSRVHPDIGPKGVDFTRYSVDLNCKNCRRLLGRGLGLNLVVEIKCHYCGTLSLFELEEMQRKRFASLPEAQMDRIRKAISC